MAKAPENFAECLDALADYLDTADRLVMTLAERLGHEDTELGNEVQEDLRQISSYLKDNPHLDSEIWDNIPALSTWTLPEEE